MHSIYSDFVATYSDSPGASFSAARAWCTFALQMCSKHPCAVFDLDQTLIDSGRKLEKAIEFLVWCKENGIFVFIVTARPTDAEEATRRQIKEAGISVDGLYMMPPLSRARKIRFADVAQYKYDARGLIGVHYSILVCVGDQWSDFASEEQLRNVRPFLLQHKHDKGVFFLPGTDHVSIRV